MSKEEMVRQALIAKGYRPEVVAGVMGNIAHETMGSFDPFQKQLQGGAGRGLFQFDGLKPHYKTWLSSNQLKDSSDNQLDFMHETVYGDAQSIIGKGRAQQLRELFNKGTTEEVTQGFSDIWLRPNPAKAHMDKRLQAAKRFAPLEEESLESLENPLEQQGLWLFP